MNASPTIWSSRDLIKPQYLDHIIIVHIQPSNIFSLETIVGMNEDKTTHAVNGRIKHLIWELWYVLIFLIYRGLSTPRHRTSLSRLSNIRLWVDNTSVCSISTGRDNSQVQDKTHRPQVKHEVPAPKIGGWRGLYLGPQCVPFRRYPTEQARGLSPQDRYCSGPQFSSKANRQYKIYYSGGF